jgi:hypothetical protein
MKAQYFGLAALTPNRLPRFQDWSESLCWITGGGAPRTTDNTPKGSVAASCGWNVPSDNVMHALEALLFIIRPYVLQISSHLLLLAYNSLFEKSLSQTVR